ncbi:type 1 glutamine amidotransferase [Falsirhodobacter sp. 20TX0035]|uniref:type 1 glutamine amidotransferase n=1 Tax=Falsirhodobacter sp. 20TX0035 TaxID=3022019 RepID=UPI00232BC922|nr:gamma-glutamyl-gamma-aminobutyrate hydrolase family protein [Falsirhodobacter sp. 20TX0035]MDB6453755.1 gamma-glutamyl-gamma-aminobutyrate hydrolase family protein [Falsirhodobacter sp. 20TX0035]
MTLRVLVVASETPDQQKTRRRSSGAASHESYADALRQMRPDLNITGVSCVEGGDPLTVRDLRGFDGIFFAGSPIQMHEESEETRQAARFMTSIFEAGTPSFGSCAGLQIAVAAAGGTTGLRSPGIEAGFARNITATEEGRSHPLLHGRGLVWTAPAMHSSVVKTLPPGTTILASNADTPVEAAEIRHGNGVFWGVQYHPELTLAEIGAALRRQGPDLIEEGLAESDAALDAHATRLQTLHDHPDRRDLAWQLGLNEDVTDAARRRLELENFLRRLEERRTG